MGKGWYFQYMVLGNWIATCTRMKLDVCLTAFSKINSKWIKDLNIRSKTVTLLEENLDKKFLYICLGNNFLYVTPKPQEQKQK